MENRTIAQAVIEVLKAAQKPMSAADITHAIVDRKLYEFSAKDPKGIVRGAIERRCEGINRKNTTSEKYFKKLPDGRYSVIN
ncbi:hypothetical protein H6F78_03960 [Coleofasciculus sp. FACHB-64]|uniref:HTH domain-containing protein n=1 Tax=Cyanophyceae TaxID=3028117 RepID=UPI0016851F51|nr:MULTISPECIES: HTH domain-containing protein [unclassified Coleofasciculus]MBD1899180.1 hypothetical protein [Coleofasciculus sp. FACHB-125]MBD2044793.1 hypothetical protein [Coleofasciculus sp. FACHB-64]MBD2540950.1 hypothetical protein [Coleofasciculus sp. FACHB-SPT36]